MLMAALRQLPHLFGRRVIVLGAFAVAAFAGVLLSIWQTWQPESALETPTAGPTKDAVARSEMPTGRAKAREAQTGKRVNDDLTHDFGVVPPRSVVTWSFPIENTSGFAWTIDKVHVLCRCTAPGVSASRIAPGKREWVTIQLDCGDAVADIIRTATVHFKEPGAPIVRIQTKAHVRAPMTPSASEISFGGIARGTSAEQAEQVVMLANYSAADWGTVRVESCPPWCEADVLPLPLGDAAEVAWPHDEAIAAPRETWQTVVRFIGKDIADGYHQGPIHFRADAGDECDVFVTGRIEPKVRIVPDRLVFGPARLGESCERVARVIVQKGTRVAALRATVDSRYILVAVRPVHDTIFELKATLVVPYDGRVPDGRINLSFADDALPEIALPYSLFKSPDSPNGG